MTDTLPDVNAPEWQDIGTEGLRFWDVQTGTGTAATTGATITVFYTGWLLNGTVFDSARTTGAPATFTLQSGSLIEGWVQGLVGMQPGGIRRLYIPTDLAYGNNPPLGSGIPQGADLVFEVKLLSVS
jgi:FKBP-type peptidyl-prolyl cis-trans isomerase